MNVFVGEMGGRRGHCEAFAAEAGVEVPVGVAAAAAAVVAVVVGIRHSLVDFEFDMVGSALVGQALRTAPAGMNADCQLAIHTHLSTALADCRC